MYQAYQDENNQAGWEQHQQLEERMLLEADDGYLEFNKSHENLLRQAIPDCNKFDEDFNNVFGN